jgi:mitochondrial fission protein ELM1
MRERGATRPFKREFERWTYAPIYDIGMVASTIRRALHLETKN